MPTNFIVLTRGLTLEVNENSANYLNVMNQNFDIFYLIQFEWNVFNMSQINILWSFSSIEASILEIFAIKNCYFLALIFVERSEKLSEKKLVTPILVRWKKAGKWEKQCFSSRLGAEIMVVCAAINLERISNFYSKVNCKLWL